MYNVEFPNLGFNFNINPVLLSFGSLTIRWYGFLIASGFLLALLYVIKKAEQYNVDTDKTLTVIIVGLISGIIGARLYYVIFYTGDKYIKDPISILYINEGGLGIYGGIILGLLGAVITTKLLNMKVLPILDLAAFGFLIGQSIGRWGNFMNQEAFGSYTDLPWGMMSENTQGLTVHPCFLYESLWCTLGFLILHLYSNKVKTKSGEIFCLYIFWYGLGRFFIEALRTDSLYIPNTTLKISQLVAVIAITSGIIIFIFLKKGAVKYAKNN